jgi:hypothetical protein
MQNRNKPARPKAGETIPLVTVRTVTVKNDKSAANQPKHGKLNYLGGPAKKSKKAPATTERVERKVFGVGQYIGDGEKLTAFVWVDDDLVTKERAANEG